MATSVTKENETHQAYDFYAKSNDYPVVGEGTEDDIIDVLKTINQLMQSIETLLVDNKNDDDFFIALNYMLKDAVSRVEHNDITSFAGVNDDDNHAKGKYKDLYASLTLRERDVLAGIVNGKMNKVIAYDLGLSVKTIESCRAKIKKKMHAKSVADLVKIVIKEEAF